MFELVVGAALLLVPTLVFAFGQSRYPVRTDLVRRRAAPSLSFALGAAFVASFSLVPSEPIAIVAGLVGSFFLARLTCQVNRHGDAGAVPDS